MSLPNNRKELRERWDSGERFEFYLFYGHKQPFSGVDSSCLSQWFERDFSVDGIEYSTAEHWMMAEKARLFEDSFMLEAILDASGPREAKAFGRKVKNFDQTTWGQHRSEIVRRGNYEKFTQNEDLKAFLLSTASVESLNLGMVAESKEKYSISFEEESAKRASASKANDKQILVEAAGRDTIWGIGLGPNNPKSRDPLQWRGLNLLGFALTEVREQIQSEEQ